MSEQPEKYVPFESVMADIKNSDELARFGEQCGETALRFIKAFTVGDPVELLACARTMQHLYGETADHVQAIIERHQTPGRLQS